MTSREALLILSAPRFGDQQHIAAVKHIEDVEAAREAFAICRHKRCRFCDGSGKVGNVVCEDCEGSGRNSGCRCFSGLSSDAVMEAKGNR